MDVALNLAPVYKVQLSLLAEQSVSLRSCKPIKLCGAARVEMTHSGPAPLWAGGGGSEGVVEKKRETLWVKGNRLRHHVLGYCKSPKQEKSNRNNHFKDRRGRNK